MKNKKLKLTDLKVQSFVTSANKINDKQTDRIAGGTGGTVIGCYSYYGSCTCPPPPPPPGWVYDPNGPGCSVGNWGTCLPRY